MKIKFWGTRGSVPTPGPDTVKFGGNTPCVEIRADNQLIILDMGTGARLLGNSLLKELPITAHVFLSHMHYDHNQGFPFFVPNFIPGNTFIFYSGERNGGTLHEQMEGCIRSPYFPVPLKAMPATMHFVDLAEGQRVNLTENITVVNRKLNHPDACYGFRFEVIEDGRKKVFTYCTDTEHYGVPDWKVVDLAKDSDVLVYDAQYTDEEYPQKVGWGHSVWREGIKVSKAANSKQLILFSHDPMHNDAKVAEIEAMAKLEFPNTLAAFEGMELEL